MGSCLGDWRCISAIVSFGTKVDGRYDDLIEEENDVVQEALRRLPAKEQYARAYRIRIAQQCGVTHTELPRDQWTKPEDVHSHSP